MIKYNSVEERLIIKYILAILIILASIVLVKESGLLNTAKGTTIVTENSYIYLPPDTIEQKETLRPLIVVFSADGNAKKALAFWQVIADRYQCIIYASRLYYTNMIPGRITEASKEMYADLQKTIAKYPINQRKIIFTGLSGGGSFAYYMNYHYPNLALMLIINSASMWEESIYEPMNDIFTTRERFSRPPIIIMLIGSRDDWYEIKRDLSLFNKLGWKVFPFEFRGKKEMAPSLVYEYVISSLQNDK